LAGAPGSRKNLSPQNTAEWVTANGQLMGPAVIGSVPSKSTTIESPVTSSFTRIQRESADTPSQSTKSSAR
jgi:hypothetical protein